MDNNKKLWFRARRYGWGWFPITWEGWTVVGCFLILTTIATIVLHHYTAPYPKNSPETMPLVKDFIAFEFAGVLTLILIGYKKGERPRWSWGDRDESKKMKKN